VPLIWNNRRVFLIPDDDDDRDGPRNVGSIQTPDAADSPRRLHRTSDVGLQQTTAPKLELDSPCAGSETREM